MRKEPEECSGRSGNSCTAAWHSVTKSRSKVPSSDAPDTRGGTELSMPWAAASERLRPNATSSGRSMGPDPSLVHSFWFGEGFMTLYSEPWWVSRCCSSYRRSSGANGLHFCSSSARCGSSSSSAPARMLTSDSSSSFSWLFAISCWISSSTSERCEMCRTSTERRRSRSLRATLRASWCSSIMKAATFCSSRVACSRAVLPPISAASRLTCGVRLSRYSSTTTFPCSAAVCRAHRFIESQMLMSTPFCTKVASPCTSPWDPISQRRSAVSLLTMRHPALSKRLWTMVAPLEIASSSAVRCMRSLIPTSALRSSSFSTR
mmetsp:Transcript_8962/g.20584  ORF Transcript_8962/g.20584 Transcript_8962/m.20584 type:complete len:319 (+) Transcript_8962:103-1059(+)